VKLHIYFQYSVGDAEVLQQEVGREATHLLSILRWRCRTKLMRGFILHLASPFNTPLEMLKYDDTVKIVDINGTFNTPLEMQTK